MKGILTAIALSSFIAAPVVADDLKEIMTGDALQLSTAEMQQTVGAGFFVRYRSTAIATSGNFANNQVLVGTLYNNQYNDIAAEAVTPYWRGGSSYAEAVSSNSVNNSVIGGHIVNYQGSSVYAGSNTY